MARRKGFAVTKETIVTAAITLIEREGPDRLGVNAVARELGIKPPSLYNHMASGQALQQAVAIEGTRRLGHYLSEGPTPLKRTKRKPDPHALVRVQCDRFRTFVQDNSALYTVMSTTVLPWDDPEFAAVGGQLIEALGQVLQPLGLEGDEAIHAIRCLRAVLHGFVLLELNSQFGLPQSIEETYDQLMHIVINNLAQTK